MPQVRELTAHQMKMITRHLPKWIDDGPNPPANPGGPWTVTLKQAIDDAVVAKGGDDFSTALTQLIGEALRPPGGMPA